MNRSATPPWPTAFLTGSYTTHIGSNCGAIPCASLVGRSRSAKRRDQVPASTDEPTTRTDQAPQLKPQPRNRFLLWTIRGCTACPRELWTAGCFHKTASCKSRETPNCGSQKQILVSETTRQRH